jgi:hypothetical protein
VLTHRTPFEELDDEPRLDDVARVEPLAAPRLFVVDFDAVARLAPARFAEAVVLAMLRGFAVLEGDGFAVFVLAVALVPPFDAVAGAFARLAAVRERTRRLDPVAVRRAADERRREDSCGRPKSMPRSRTPSAWAIS